MENNSSAPLHEQLLATPADPQEQSRLFSHIPAEVRNAIFRLALTDYLEPDPAKRYNSDTLFSRPSYSAPRRTDTALLRTCRAAYREAWFLPFILREHTHYLGHDDRAPPDYGQSHTLNIRNLTTILQKYQVGQQSEAEADGDKERIVEIDSLRVFTQMFKLEEGFPLANLIKTPGLRFRRLTITLRHTDWWYWERDNPLSISGSNLISNVSEVLPATVREIVFELESVERKKGQIDSIAAQMREKWFFKRADGAILFADASEPEEMDGGSVSDPYQEDAIVSRWSGSSTWQETQWLRDETEDGRIDYYIRRVLFRPKERVEVWGGRISQEALENAESGEFDVDRLNLDLPNERPMPRSGQWSRSTRVRGPPRRGPDARGGPYGRGVGDATRRFRDLRLQRPPTS